MPDSSVTHHDEMMKQDEPGVSAQPAQAPGATHASGQVAQPAAPKPVAPAAEANAGMSAASETATAASPSAAATSSAADARKPARTCFDATGHDSKARAEARATHSPSVPTPASAPSSSSAAAALRIVLASNASTSRTPSLATEVLPAPPRLPSDATYAPLAPDVRPEGGLLSLQPGITAAAQAANRKKAQLAAPALMLSLHADGSNRKGPVMPTALKEVITGQPIGGEKAAAARAAGKKR